MRPSDAAPGGATGVTRECLPVLTAGLVAEATGGQLLAGDASRVFRSASTTDSRTMTADVFRRLAAPGALVHCALQGPTFDGTRLCLEQVIAERRRWRPRVSRPLGRQLDGAAVILVDDTLDALQRLGHSVRVRSGAPRWWRSRAAPEKLPPRKPRAKFLARDVSRVSSNEGNLNNHIGPSAVTHRAATGSGNCSG